MHITKKQIDSIFEAATEPAAYIIALYKLVVPDWDKAKKVEGYPRCGKALSEYLWQKSIGFDTEYKKEVATNYLVGGMWLNYGFSDDAKGLDDWEVSLDKVTIKK